MRQSFLFALLGFLGLNWRSAWNIQANAEVAFPVDHTPEQMNDRDDHQYWLSVRKTF